MADEMITASVEGYEAARGAVERAVKIAKPEGKLGQAVMFATVEAHRYAVSVAHVDTGTLRSAISMRMPAWNHGQVYVGHNVNPRSHQPASRYAPYEEAHGGEHAFFGRVISEQGQSITSRAIEILKDGL